MTTPEASTPAAAKFEYGEKQELLRESARKFLEARFSTTRVRELLETERAHDGTAWKEMADLGSTEVIKREFFWCFCNRSSGGVKDLYFISLNDSEFVIA